MLPAATLGTALVAMLVVAASGLPGAVPADADATAPREATAMSEARSLPGSGLAVLQSNEGDDDRRERDERDERRREDRDEQRREREGVR